MQQQVSSLFSYLFFPIDLSIEIYRAEIGHFETEDL